MPIIEVTLPSGARGRVRGLKGREINIFANQSAAKRSKTSLQILENTFIETIDPGPLYAASNDRLVDWKIAPQCDRFTALFYVRIATYGPHYDIKHKCSNRDCLKRYEWRLDLSTTSVKPLPESSIEKFLAGNRFDGVLVDNEGNDRKFKFQLLTPKLEDKMDKVQSMAPRERATVSLAQRIISIEGLEEGKTPIKRFLEDLDAIPFEDLLEDMDSVDGGIDTDVELECPYCGLEEVLDLPLGDEFWRRPSKKRSSE